MKHLVKDLDWQFCDYFYEVVYRVETDIYHYAVRQDKKRGTVEVDYYKEDMMKPSKTATGFKTLEQGKEWAFNHHCEKLSKWIDADTDTSVTEWFKRAKPKPTAKDVSTQVGCIFEEVAELAEAINAKAIASVLSDFADKLKNMDNKTAAAFSEYINDLEALDATTDIKVTLAGFEYMKGYDGRGALREVNASNWSKFENGRPLLDDNGKIKKGADYIAPDLYDFF